MILVAAHWVLLKPRVIFYFIVLTLSFTEMSFVVNPILRSSPLLADEELVHLVLYGNEKFKFEDNQDILIATINFIRNTSHFSQTWMVHQCYWSQPTSSPFHFYLFCCVSWCGLKCAFNHISCPPVSTLVIFISNCCIFIVNVVYNMLKKKEGNKNSNWVLKYYLHFFQ